MENSLYSTGEFAQLCGVKKQTLFHYDSIGLLKPAHIDENGFRHYSYSQYEEYLVIACLKEAGMSLRSIKAYLDTKDKAQRARVLQDCITQLDEKIEYLKHVRQVLANSFPKQTNDQAHPAELEKDTTLLYREQQEYWATQRLDALDDKQLVEAVAKIVKVAELPVRFSIFAVLPLKTSSPFNCVSPKASILPLICASGEEIVNLPLELLYKAFLSLVSTVTEIEFFPRSSVELVLYGLDFSIRNSIEVLREFGIS